VVPCPWCAGPSELHLTGCADLEYFTPADADYRRCPDCRLVFLHPRPGREELAALYPPEYQNFDRPRGRLARWLTDRYHARHAAVVRRHVPPGGRVLEVGCADGALLARLRDDGYEVAGVEISKDACERAWERRLPVFCGTLEEYPGDETFDLVLASHVIEHTLDPQDTAAHLAARLRPGGVAYVETPNVGSPDARLFGNRWGLLHYPRHLYLFDRGTLRTLLERAGLRMERLRWEPNSCGWALSVQTVLRRAGIDRSRRPRSAYYPALLVLLLPLNLVDVVAGGTAFMAAVARRPER
jgi:SAM-dependent methyltransferase